MIGCVCSCVDGTRVFCWRRPGAGCLCWVPHSGSSQWMKVKPPLLPTLKHLSHFLLCCTTYRSDFICLPSSSLDPGLWSSQKVIDEETDRQIHTDTETYRQKHALPELVEGKWSTQKLIDGGWTFIPTHIPVWFYKPANGAHSLSNNSHSALLVSAYHI